MFKKFCCSYFPDTFAGAVSFSQKKPQDEPSKPQDGPATQEKLQDDPSKPQDGPATQGVQLYLPLLKKLEILPV